MNKLLSAGFVRLKKDKVFWAIMGFMVIMALVIVINAATSSKEYQREVGLEELMFKHVLFMGIFMAAFSGLFLGTEYSEGTIRNKLVIGHTRKDIYLSSLIISITAGIAICLSFIVTTLLSGLALVGTFSKEADMKLVLQAFLLTLLITGVFCALFTMCSMLNRNKSLNCVLVIMGMFAMLMVSSYIYAGLNEPEMWESYVYEDETGEIVKGASEPNPYYVSGAKREVYEFLIHFLPTGQAALIGEGDLSHAGEMADYSILIMIGSTAAGLYFFKKKDIK